MKKNLLFAALVLPLLSVSAQWTQTGGTVVVKPNTLHYITGDYTVDDGSSLNEGNVNVRSNFAVEDSAEFRNVWNDRLNYGQLIINDASTATGIMIGEFKNTEHDQFYKQPLGVPFIGISAADLADQAGIITPYWPNHPANGVFDNQRWRASVNVWDNENYANRDLREDDEIGTDYQSYQFFYINQMVDSLDIRLSEYAGTPANIQHELPIVTYTILPGSESQVNSYSRNIFGEMLGTYLKDPFVEMDYSIWSTPGRVLKPAGFGENLFYFGNPYTSNIDLTPSLVGGQITGVQQRTETSFDPNVDQGNSNLNVPANPKITTWDGSNWAGDTEVLEVRPFHTFILKTNGGANNTTFSLNEDNKTFDVAAAAPSFVDRSFSNPLYQLKMELVQEDIFIDRTYVVAAPSYQAAAQAGNEAYKTDFDSSFDGIYTLQENEDGSVNQELINNKTYINGINQNSYVAKPIMLVHQVANPGEFTLKGILTPDVLNSNNEFYFEDYETGFIQNITADFEYNFTASETTTDRFRIYWNGTPEQLSVEDITLVAKSIVYKDHEQFKVRFAKDWNTADVYVYNMMGQLIHSAKQVDTSFDYTLPLRKHSAAYIVKAVGDNGNTMTQKIITK